MIAGATTAAVVIPKAMAYATVAGLPVEVGLYTVFVPMLVYAIVGTSRVLSVSTTTTIAILAGTQLAQVVPDGDRAALLAAAATLTLLVGGLLALASLLRLGFVANFISEPVLVGFKAGIGLVIVLDQVPKLLGVHFAKGGFVQNLVRLVESLPDTSLATLAVALATLAILLGLERFLPRAPAPLIAVAAGIAAFGLLALPVESVGQVPQGLPHFIRPDLSLVAALWPGALGIALMSFTETIAAARAFAQSGEPPLRPNQELFATGLANAARRGVRVDAGGRRHLADRGEPPRGRAHAAGGDRHGRAHRDDDAGARPADRPPAAGHARRGRDRLLDRADPARRVSRDPERAAHGVSLGAGGARRGRAARNAEGDPRRGDLVARVAGPPGRRSAGLRDRAQAGHQRIPAALRRAPRRRDLPRPADACGSRGACSSRTRSASARRCGRWSRRRSPSVVVLDLRAVFDLEYTALKMLTEAEERQRERGVELWLVGLNPEVLSVVQRSPLGERLGRERMHFNLETAVAKYLA